MGNTYVVATIKSWNIENFDKFKKEISHSREQILIGKKI